MATAGAGVGVGGGMPPLSMAPSTRFERVDFASRFTILEEGMHHRKVDRVSQAAVATAFDELKALALSSSPMASFVADPVLDEDDNPITQVGMSVQLSTGAITLVKGEKRVVCLLKDFEFTADKLTQAQKLLVSMGKQIGATGVWDPLRSAHTDSLDTLPLMKDRRSVIPPNLHECMRKDIVKCRNEAEVKRYVGIVRHGAVMKHEHRSGLELLKLRYLGERADISEKLSTESDPIQKTRLQKELKRIEQKVDLIDKKITQIDQFDGYALSKMALYASRCEGVTTDEQREAIARECKADIVAELQPLLSKNRTLKNPFGRETTSKESIEKFAAMVAGTLLSDAQRSRLEGFKCSRPFEAAVCFDPAVSAKNFTSALPDGIYDDLGDECKAFMYEIHDKANYFGRMAGEEVPKDKNGHPIDLSTKDGYLEILDASSCSIKGLQSELLGKDHREKGIEQKGRYSSINVGSRSLFSASYELEELKLSYHIVKKNPGTQDEEKAAILEFRQRNRENISYEILKDKIQLDYTNAIFVRNSKKAGAYLSVPPLRRFTTSDRTALGDRPINPLHHYSRKDLAQAGDQLYDAILGQSFKDIDALVAARGGLVAELPPDAPGFPYVDDPDIDAGAVDGMLTPPAATPEAGRSRASSTASATLGMDGVEMLEEGEGMPAEGVVHGADESVPPLAGEDERGSSDIDARVDGILTADTLGAGSPRPSPVRPLSPF